MNSSTQPESVEEPEKVQPQPDHRERMCGTFLLRQGMESWTQAKRDAFIAEFGYI